MVDLKAARQRIILLDARVEALVELNQILANESGEQRVILLRDTAEKYIGKFVDEQQALMLARASHEQRERDLLETVQRYRDSARQAQATMRDWAGRAMTAERDAERAERLRREHEDRADSAEQAIAQFEDRIARFDVECRVKFARIVELEEASDKADDEIRELEQTIENMVRAKQTTSSIIEEAYEALSEVGIYKTPIADAVAHLVELYNQTRESLKEVSDLHARLSECNRTQAKTIRAYEDAVEMQKNRLAIHEMNDREMRETFAKLGYREGALPYRLNLLVDAYKVACAEGEKALAAETPDCENCEGKDGAWAGTVMRCHDFLTSANVEHHPRQLIKRLRALVEQRDRLLEYDPDPERKNGPSATIRICHELLNDAGVKRNPGHLASRVEDLIASHHERERLRCQEVARVVELLEENRVLQKEQDDAQARIEMLIESNAQAESKARSADAAYTLLDSAVRDVKSYLDKHDAVGLSLMEKARSIIKQRDACEDESGLSVISPDEFYQLLIESLQKTGTVVIDTSLLRRKE